MKKIIIPAFLLSLTATVTEADVTNIDDQTYISPYGNVEPQDIVDAILDKNFDYAINLIKDLAIEKVRETVFTERGQIKIAKLVANKLDEIINDNSKTSEDKKKDVFSEIESHFSSHYSRPFGKLNIILSHAPGLGITKISWDQQIDTDTCRTTVASINCSIDPYTNLQNCHESIEYREDTVIKFPDYTVYRVVDNEKFKIAEIEGFRQIEGSRYTISNPWDAIRSAYDYYKKTPKEIKNFSSRAFVYDTYGDMYNDGKKVQYQVISDNHDQKYGKCGHSETIYSTANQDIDGDGYPDYIPKDDLGISGSTSAALLPLMMTTNP